MRIRCPQTLLHGVVLMCMHLAPLRRHPICMVALIRSNLARCPQTLLHGVVLIRLAPLRRHPICMAFIRSNLARCPHTLLHGVVLMCIRLAPLRRRSICTVAFIRSNLARCPHTLLHGVVLSFLVFMLVPVCLRHQRFVHCHRDHRRPAAAAAAAAASQSARTCTIAAAPRIAAASAAVAVVADRRFKMHPWLYSRKEGHPPFRVRPSKRWKALQPGSSQRLLGLLLVRAHNLRSRLPSSRNPFLVSAVGKLTLAPPVIFQQTELGRLSLSFVWAASLAL